MKKLMKYFYMKYYKRSIVFLFLFTIVFSISKTAFAIPNEKEVEKIVRDLKAFVYSETPNKIQLDDLNYLLQICDQLQQEQVKINPSDITLVLKAYQKIFEMYQNGSLEKLHYADFQRKWINAVHFVLSILKNFSFSDQFNITLALYKIHVSQDLDFKSFETHLILDQLNNQVRDKRVSQLQSYYNPVFKESLYYLFFFSKWINQPNYLDLRSQLLACLDEVKIDNKILEKASPDQKWETRWKQKIVALMDSSLSINLQERKNDNEKIKQLFTLYFFQKSFSFLKVFENKNENDFYKKRERKLVLNHLSNAYQKISFDLTQTLDLTSIQNTSHPSFGKQEENQSDEIAIWIHSFDFLKKKRNVSSVDFSVFIKGEKKSELVHLSSYQNQNFFPESSDLFANSTKTEKEYTWITQGLIFQIDSKGIVKVVSQPHILLPKKLKIMTDLKVVLEGQGVDDVQVVSAGAQIDHEWISNKLSLSSHFLLAPDEVKHQIEKDALLQLEKFDLSFSTLINRGNFVSDNSLRFQTEKAKFVNEGVFGSKKKITIVDLGCKSQFHNYNKIISHELEWGSWFQKLETFINLGMIHADQMEAHVRNFENPKEIQVTNDLFLQGYHFSNKNGKCHSGGEARLDFFVLDNTQGNFSGVKITDVRVREKLFNDKGEFGTNSYTYFQYSSKQEIDQLGLFQGNKILLDALHIGQFNLSNGTLLATEELKIQSFYKASLPQVQIQTPLLKLSVPDFMLEEQKHCEKTIVECDPTRDFNLTSPFCTYGKLCFFETKKNEYPIQKDLNELDRCFEKGCERGGDYDVSINANLKSNQKMEFILPLGSIYLGNDSQLSPDQLTLEAESLSAITNFFYVQKGTVATKEAYIESPCGLVIGRVIPKIEQPASTIFSLIERFFNPTRKRQIIEDKDGSSWTTAGATHLRGPLRCNGYMKVGALHLNSENPHLCNSCDILVQGDMTLKGQGQFKLLRHLGERIENKTYSPASRLTVRGRLSSKNPSSILNDASIIYAHQKGDLVSIIPKDRTAVDGHPFPEESTSNTIKANYSSSTSSVMPNQTGEMDGVILAPEIVLIHTQGKLVIGNKNPYYKERQNPLQSLTKKEFNLGTTSVTEDLKKIMGKKDALPYHFALRERFFFQENNAQEFYKSIHNDIVVFSRTEGLKNLSNKPQLFFLSPELLLDQAQNSCQNNLMRGYIYANQTLTLENLKTLHKNTREYFEKIGMASSQNLKDLGYIGTELKIEEALDLILASKNKNLILPTEPMIFYEELMNDQGVLELKPYIYYPEDILEQARNERHGNIFATILKVLPGDLTADELIEWMSEEPIHQQGLIELFEKNPETKQALTSEALKYKEKINEQGLLKNDSKQEIEVTGNSTIPQMAIISKYRNNYNANWKGKNLLLASIKDSVIVESKVERKINGSDYYDVISDQASLNAEEKVVVMAQKDTVFKGAHTDSGVSTTTIAKEGMNIHEPIYLKQHHEFHSKDRNESFDQTSLHKTSHTSKGEVVTKGYGVIFQAVNTDADGIEFHTQGGYSVSLVRNPILDQDLEEEIIYLYLDEQGFLEYAARSPQTRLIERKKINEISFIIPSSLEKKSLALVKDNQISGKIYEDLHIQSIRNALQSSTPESTLSLSVEAHQDLFDLLSHQSYKPAGQFAILGAQTSTHHSVETTEETGWGPWKGESKKINSSSQSQFVPSQLKVADGKEIKVNLKRESALFEAPKIIGNMDISALQGRVKFTQGVNQSSHSAMELSKNPFWIQMKSEASEDKTYTQTKIEGKVNIKAKFLELEQVEGKVLNFLDQLEYDKDQVEVIHKTLIELHHLQSKSLSLPGPGLVAMVAIAATIATQGAGGAAVAALGTGLNATVSTMLAAAVSSLAAQASTQIMVTMLSGGGPQDFLKTFSEPNTFKNMATSMVTAGAVQGAESLIGSLKDSAVILQKAEQAAVQASVGVGTDLLIEKKSFNEALESGGIAFASQTVSSFVTHHIGKLYGNQEIGYTAHKALHGGTAAAVASVAAAATNRDIGAAAVGAATGAMIAETVAEGLASSFKEDLLISISKKEEELGRRLEKVEVEELGLDKIHQITQLSRLSGVIATGALGNVEGIHAANQSSQTALENNFGPGILLGALAIVTADYFLEGIMSNNQHDDPDAIIPYPFSIEGGVQKVASKAMNKIAPGSSVVFNAIKKRKNDFILKKDTLTSQAARREVLRKEKIPTSQQPISQTKNASGRQYQYEVSTEGGGTKIKSVQQQTMDRSHPGESHWEGGNVKIGKDGKIKVNNYGAARLDSEKSKVNYDK